jgi:hypothetical protein
LPIGDYPLLLYNAQFGKINFMKDVMGVYRIHEAGVWGQFHDSLEKISPRWIQLLEKIEDKFSPEVNKYLSQHKKNSLFDLYKSYSAKKKSVKAKEVILQLMEYDPYFLANMIINNQKKLDNTLNSNIYKVGKIISKFITMFFPFITSKKNS